MPHFLDEVPFSGIIRIRDMMYSVQDPFRLDQGDVSFDAPSTLKEALIKAVHDNRTHYVQTTGIPRLLELLARKLREKNGLPVASPSEVMVTNGGIHAIYVACLALLEPGDEIIMPDPAWPPAVGNVACARAVAVRCPLHESLGWRWDLDELERTITPRTRAIYVNSPGNPTGGVFTRADLERVAALARDRNLWVISDEAYEDVVYEGRHASIAALPGMYERTVSTYTMSKTYAITGLRLGYLAASGSGLLDRMRKVVLYTTSNVSSLVQYGAIGALEGSQACVEEFRTELEARRDLFYAGLDRASGGMLAGNPPRGAFYAFVRIHPAWQPPATDTPSRSWAMTEHLIRHARVGSVPGIDFGPKGENHVRFCFARNRTEIQGALDSMREVFSGNRVPSDG
jgi:aspartate/methionine/tyrosine aminotransferase